MTPPPEPPARPRKWAVVSASGALIALVGGWIAAEAVQRPGRYDPVRDTISSLARHGADDRWIMTAGLYLIGICHLLTAAGLRGLPRHPRLLLAVAGVAGLGLGACAQPDHGSADSHLAFAVLGLVVLAVWPLTVTSRSASHFPLRPRDAVLSGLLSLALLGWLVTATAGSTLGIAERALTFQQELWPLLVVAGARRSAADALATRRSAARAGRLAGWRSD